MTFTLLNDVFEDNPSNIKMLDKIWLLTEERHTLFLDDDDIIEELLASEWFKSLRQLYQKEIGDLVTQSFQMSKPKTILVISNKESDAFSLVEAFEILNQTFFILLENGENDAYFIKALIKNFQKKGKKIEKHLNEGWLEFGMGGGSTIPSVINAAKERFYRNKEKFPKESSYYLRFFVLIDSDKQYPNQHLKNEKQALINSLKYDNVPFHILQKREMENYMPDEVFREIQGNDDYIRAYLTLNATQKDYFDVENGFPDKNFDNLPIEVQALYEDLDKTPSNIHIFRKQKLEIKDKNGRNRFKSEFPKLFLTENVNQGTLLARAGSNELQEILDKITELL